MNVVHVAKIKDKFKVLHNFIQIGCELSSEVLAEKYAQQVAKVAGVSEVSKLYVKEVVNA